MRVRELFNEGSGAVYAGLLAIYTGLSGYYTGSEGVGEPVNNSQLTVQNTMTTYEKYLQLQHLSYDTNYHAIMLVYCGPYILGLSEYCEINHSREQAVFRPGSEEEAPINNSQSTVQNTMMTYEEYLTMADLADNMLYWDLMSAYEPYILSLSDDEESELSG